MKTPSPDQVVLFKRLFVRGQQGYYGTYFKDSGRYVIRKEPITDEVIAKHLAGDVPLGVFPLVGQQVNEAVVDFDSPDTDPVVRFRTEARRLGLCPYIERSKGKGFHVWFFWQDPVEAKLVVQCLRAVLASIGTPETEVFPKQVTLEPGAFGSFMNCPLFGALVPEGKTVFLQDDFTPWPDQWQFLAGIQPAAAGVLEEAVRHLGALPAARGHGDRHRPPVRSDGDLLRTRGLLPCKTRMLSEGVTKNQRLSAFYLAVSLMAAGIPEASAVAILLDWRQRNRPQDGRTFITEAEVSAQVGCAYDRSYAGHGCRNEAVAPFCSDDCILKRRPPASGGAEGQE